MQKIDHIDMREPDLAGRVEEMVDAGSPLERVEAEIAAMGLPEPDLDELREYARAWQETRPRITRKASIVPVQ